MRFSPELEARFQRLLESYPPDRQRSALIPMLLYAQEEVGAVTPAVVEEVASRLGLAPLEVEEVVSYYAMLRRRPAGRRHIRICTNISCLLRGGEELWRHACRKLGAGNGGVTPDGEFSIEEAECLGACSWAPALMVDYEYHHAVTPEEFDRLLDNLRRRS